MTKKSPARLARDKEGSQPVEQVVFSQNLHVGPLPPPETLAGYDKVSPGLASRIIEHAEKEQAHRHEMELNAITAPHTEAVIGQAFGLLIGLSGLAGSIILAMHDKTTSSIAIGGGTLVALVAVFIKGAGR